MANLSGRTYSEEFTDLNSESLEDIAEQLLFDADHIEHQIDMRKANAETLYGEPVDPQWLAKASYAMKTKRRKYSAIQRILKNRKEAGRDENDVIADFIHSITSAIQNNQLANA